MKKRICYKILFLIAVMTGSHLGTVSASSNETLDRIRNISDQNVNQDTEAGKNTEKKIEKQTEKVLEKEDESNDLENEEELEENIKKEKPKKEKPKKEKPKIEKVTLVENYKEEYKTYEEIMGDEHFFYSSIENGGWTDQKVHIEFPAKMKVKVKKDGVEYKYVKGRDFTKKGTYYFTLEVKESENKILRANFHFRIQPKPKKTPEELKAEEALNNVADLSRLAEYEKRLQEIARDLSGSKITDNSIPKINDFLGDVENIGNTTVDPQEESKKEEPNKEEPNIEDINQDNLKKEIDEIKKEEPTNPIMDEKGEIKEDELNKLIGKLDKKEKQEAEKEEVTFDVTTGLFKNALKSGDAFLTNVMNGSITNQSVMIAKSDTLTFKLFRNGKLVEDFNPGSYVEEAGSYVLYPNSEALAFKAAYKEMKPIFTFRIIGSSPVRDLGILPLSPDAKLIDIQINGKNYTDAVLGKSAQMLKLWKDGTYKITTTDKAGEHTLNIVLDRVSPKFQVNLLENQAQIKYLSNDVARFELYKDKTLEKEGEILELIEGAGTYRLVVIDRAGNRSESTFSIKYQINQAALIAIAIVFALIIAGIFFFKRMNKTVKVR